jgi:hypothetical protein
MDRPRQRPFSIAAFAVVVYRAVVPKALQYRFRVISRHPNLEPLSPLYLSEPTREAFCRLGRFVPILLQKSAGRILAATIESERATF